MAGPFKNLISPAVVARIANRLQQEAPGFDRARFVALASDGLETLELKARALRICAALEATLPADFARSAALLEATMHGDGALDGWALWPVGEYVARHGQDDPERALALLRRMTPRFSAEFAIRPFIVRHPALSFETLARWSADPDEHVRRLVSEGSRPRLPWGLRLKALVDDPSPTLPLLLALQDDPSAYVRRSVANHLNDIAKDHPGRIADWLDAHLPDATRERRALLRHASRTLVKQGDPRVLATWGIGGRLRGSATLAVMPARIALGDSVTLTLALQSTAARAQTLAIDYAVHHVKANGATSAKVFKGWSVELPARAALTLVRHHSMRPVTTRRYHAGRHGIEVRINGRTVARGAFVLDLPA